ncbi:MAG: hypothetical protein H8E76_06125 [Helicobacteraceae bacterium]|nr:hypothetical protein [Candidatus Sulfurimonas ponti]MBL6972894.1 hypothetical protein [Sulfurimonas sp.]
MKEPRLEDIKDYENLDTERKRALIAIVLVAIIMGMIYTVLVTFFDTGDDRVEVEESFKMIPMK